MSLILDALKKLDREKAAKRAETVDIASGILLREKSRRRSMYVPAMAVLFAAFAAAAVTYYWTATPPGATRPESTTAASAVQATPATPSAPPVTNQVPAAESRPGPAAQPGGMPASGQPAPSAGPVKPAEKAKPGNPPDVAPARAAERNGDSGTASRSAFKVSGIVWQEDRQARRAFVNDVRVREGDMIKDARVVEIHPDRVSFSRDGNVFDIRLFE